MALKFLKRVKPPESRKRPPIDDELLLDCFQRLDGQTEPAKVREWYGRNKFGQSVLLGRRLVEAGVRLVHVNWIRILEQGWDTHNDNFNALRERLLPPADQAISALLDDMEARGLLDETLVIVMGEFGRSPQITRTNAGREHWPFVRE